MQIKQIFHDFNKLYGYHSSSFAFIDFEMTLLNPLIVSVSIS